MAAVTAAALVVLAGCGGGGGPTQSGAGAATGTKANAPELTYIRRADRICERAVKQTQALGRRFNATPPPTTDPVALTTEGLVRPGVKILEREAAALRELRPRPDNAELEDFIGLFDPIVVLSRQRVALSDSSKLGEARRLELLVNDLQDEQRIDARRFGLRICGTSFVDALAGR